MTPEEKEKRAEEIVLALSDNGRWHSHGCMVGNQTLRETLCLKIEDFGTDKDLRTAIRRYSDTLTNYLQRANAPFYVYNRTI